MRTIKDSRSARQRKKLHKRFIPDIRYGVLSSNEWLKKITSSETGKVFSIRNKFGESDLIEKYDLKYCVVSVSTCDEDLYEIYFFSHEFKEVNLTAYVTKPNSIRHKKIIEAHKRRMND